MAQPSPYARTANFTALLAGTSVATLGPRLDAEFDAARLTIEATRTNIGQIQRDDLLLKNRSVNVDQLGDSVLTLFAEDGLQMRGDWATGAVYAPGDLFVDDGKIYMVKTTHTASTDLDVDIAAGKVVGPVFDPELALQFTAAAVYETWAELSAATGELGDAAIVQVDAGTHTDPVVGGTVSNQGSFLWKDTPAPGWKRIGDTDAMLAAASAQLAADWAEKATAPAGGSTKSAKTWATEAAASAVTAANVAANLTQPIGISLYDADGIVEGYRDAEPYQPFDGEATRFTGKVTSGTGTADVTLYVNDALTYGPITISSTVTFTDGLSLSILEGQEAKIEVSDITGSVLGLFVRFEVIPA